MTNSVQVPPIYNVHVGHYIRRKLIHQVKKIGAIQFPLLPPSLLSFQCNHWSLMRGVCVLTMHVYTKFVESLQQCTYIIYKTSDSWLCPFCG